MFKRLQTVTVNGLKNISAELRCSKYCLKDHQMVLDRYMLSKMCFVELIVFYHILYSQNF